MIRDAEKGKIESEKPALEEEKEVLKLYSKRLVNKLEKKVLDLEREITERKKAEEKLRLLSAAVEQSSEGIAISDLEGQLLFTNNAFAAMHGYMPEELLGKHLSIFHTPEQVPSVEVANRQMKETGEFSAEIWHVRRDGSVFPTLMDNSLLRDEAGNPIGMIGTLRDITERKRAEEALRESEERLRAIVESAHDAIFTKDLEGHYIHVNAACASLFGLTMDEMRGKTDFDLFPPQVARHIQEIDRAVTEKGEAIAIEDTKPTTGVMRTFHVSRVPLLDANGEIMGLCGIARDITDRKRAENLVRSQRDLALALSAAVGLEEALQLCFDTAIRVSGMDCGGVYLVDEASGIIDLAFHQGLSSDFIDRASHYEADSVNARLIMPGKPIYTKYTETGVPLDDVNRRESLRAIAVIPICYEERVIACLNIASHTLDEVPVFARDALDTITAQIGSAIARVKAEEALKESEEKYSSLINDAIDSLSSGIFILDKDFKVVWINRAIEEFFGIERDSIIGCNKREAIKARIKYIFEDPEQFERTVLRTYDDNIYVEYFECHVLPLADRKERFLLHWSRPIRTGAFAGGRIEHYYDITKRKRADEAMREYSERLEEMVEKRTKELRDAQEQIVQKERMAVLGQLAGGVAHELRNPLGAIKNAAYFLNMVLEKPEPKVKEALEILEEEVTTSDRVISSLLDYARPKSSLRRKVNINDVLRKALSRMTVPENVDVVTQLDKALPNTRADPDQLGQAFGNIIVNAIQAMPEGGQLSVKSEVPGPKIMTISFADTGVGIAKENLGKLFEPLFTTKAKGIGLGLALTKILVEGHGGTIEVDSKVGKGSTFTVRLPVGLTIEA